MENFIDFISPIVLAVFISFLLMCCFFGTVVEKIERLEKYHNICSECGQVLHN